jgi:nitroreductase
MIKYTLKKILSRSQIEKIQGMLETADIRIASIASRNKALSVIYYTIFSSDFLREMQSVLVARAAYHQSSLSDMPNSFLLRRNIHRLEKGLIMRPRRLLFGDKYVGTTVNVFHDCLNTGCLSRSEYSWCMAVFTEYFAVACGSDAIDRARESFNSIVQNSPPNPFDPDNKPIPYPDLGTANVSFKDFKSLCNRRHSVRWFEPRSVPKQLLEEAIDVAAMAPSACNRQPFKFYVFDEPHRAQEIGAMPMGTAGFANNFQAVIVVVGDLSAYPFEKDRHIIYIDCGLAVMQLQLALETQGLGSCVINWPDIERHERQMAIELKIKPYERPVMLVAVGYPLAEGKVPYSAKKTVSDLVVRPK